MLMPLILFDAADGADAASMLFFRLLLPLMLMLPHHDDAR